ncbi:uncharacterized protein LOC119107551 [Pollicipes pollicipes]|uniref:uncharacterized protein LOC119107551 n=1 Tax=Pollicipes pollicipes TaxID=41117 RepID=UPI001884E344|nr:uncharacterized protein LOC119107551 [Pollicipes pollicipes]
MKKAEIDITLPSMPTDEEISDDVESATTEDAVFAELAERLAAAGGEQQPGSEALFLQAHRLVNTSHKLRHGSRHVRRQMELLLRERARLALLVSEAGGHLTAERAAGSDSGAPSGEGGHGVTGQGTQAAAAGLGAEN